MRMKVNRLTKELLDTSQPLVVCEGGTYSGKTWSILHYLIWQALSEKQTVTTVVGQDIPALRKGAYRDAKHIIYGDKHLAASVADHNKSERKITFVTGSVLEFDSFSDPEDAKHGKRDYCFLNEANGIPYDTFKVLDQRTRKRTLIDFNPSFLFWSHEHLRGRDDVLWHHSTYKDNAFIDPAIKRKIEQTEPTPENIASGTANEYYWKVYGKGEYAPREGAVFEDWTVCSEDDIPAPDDCKLHGFGLDFGFSNSPAAVVECSVTSGGTLYLREHLYDTGLTNDDLASRIGSIVMDHDIIADSAEPKSIEELNRAGLHVYASRKGKDSIIHGIQTMQQHDIRIASTSKNLVKEFEAYRWDEDRSGTRLNRPVKAHDHAVDAARYCLSYLTQPQIDYSVF